MKLGKKGFSLADSSVALVIIAGVMLAAASAFVSYNKRQARDRKRSNVLNTLLQDIHLSLKNDKICKLAYATQIIKPNAPLTVLGFKEGDTIGETSARIKTYRVESVEDIQTNLKRAIFVVDFEEIPKDLKSADIHLGSARFSGSFFVSTNKEDENRVIGCQTASSLAQSFCMGSGGDWTSAGCNYCKTFGVDADPISPTACKRVRNIDDQRHYCEPEWLGRCEGSLNGGCTPGRALLGASYFASEGLGAGNTCRASCGPSGWDLQELKCQPKAR